MKSKHENKKTYRQKKNRQKQSFQNVQTNNTKHRALPPTSSLCNAVSAVSQGPNTAAHLVLRPPTARIGNANTAMRKLRSSHPSDARQGLSKQNKLTQHYSLSLTSQTQLLQRCERRQRTPQRSATLSTQTVGCSVYQ
jgi:hypothetical protein